MRVLQITPEADPVQGGVAASARAVADELRRNHGIESDFVSASELRADRECRRQPTAGRVLLHYANYGYASRGCPWWLLGLLRRWQREGRLERLVTVFHELYASGPPWTSAFWLGPAQRYLARRIAGASAGLVTSHPLYASILGAWTRRADVLTLPVPSTVGEPDLDSASDPRAARMVVFGTPGTRERAYVEHPRALAAAARALGLQEILDIGGPGPRVPSAVEGLPVVSTGALPAAEVSRLLRGSVAGFLAYPPYLLEKSSVFAAYAAHGLAVVCAWPAPRRGALQPLRQFLEASSLTSPVAPGAVLSVAAGAHAWYREHRASRQAELLARLVRA